MEESIGTDPSTITLREAKAEEVIVLSFETSEIKLEQALKLKGHSGNTCKDCSSYFFHEKPPKDKL